MWILIYSIRTLIFISHAFTGADCGKNHSVTEPLSSALFFLEVMPVLMPK